ncbi:MAG: DUF2079 domain-containing protein [Candidatus Ozemobacteraceae bacterium]
MKRRNFWLFFDKFFPSDVSSSPRVADDSSETESNHSFPSFALVAMLFLWFSFCCYVTWLRWQCWDIGIDTTVWGQSLFFASKGLPYQLTTYVGLDQTIPRPLLSFHFYLLLPFFSLFYKLFPNPAYLLVLQHLAHALGGWFIACIVWNRSSENRLVTLAATAAWLFYPPLARAQVAYDFSPQHLAAFFLPLAAWAATAGHHRIALGSLVFLACGEENMSLVAGFSALSLAWMHPERRGMYLIAAPLFLLYTIVVLKFGIPAFLPPGIENHFLNRYSGLLEHPGDIIQMTFNAPNGAYLLSLLAPLLFLPLIYPHPWLLATIPFVAQNLLSPGIDTRLIGHHYTTVLAIACFLGALFGILRSGRRLVFFSFSMAIICLFLIIFREPVLPWAWEGADGRTVELGNNLAPLATIIPSNASLSAPPVVGAHFWARDKLWFFPQGANEAEWIVVPKYQTSYPAVDITLLKNWISRFIKEPHVRRVLENDDIIVFRREQLH